MSNGNERPPDVSVDRRSVLLATATVGLTGLAGCSGGGGGDGTPTNDGDDPTTDGSDETQTGAGSDPTSGGTDGTPAGGGEDTTSDGTEGGGDGCPSSPSAYERRPFPPAVNRDESVASVEVPASGATIVTDPGFVRVGYGSDTINFTVTAFPDADIETVAGDPDEANVVTGEYDLPSGSLVVDNSGSGSIATNVYLPMGSGSVRVQTGVFSTECLEALRPIHDHMVSSLELV